jgi:exopolysaccharide biosynthesis predicted pyruvyltransferase EpsI
VPTCKESYGINAEIMQDAGPMDWLSLVANAEAVVTDSFHGCVFSLIYSKQFYVFRRFADSNSKSQNSRVYTLLEEYSLNKCLIEADSPIDKAFIEKDEYLKVTEKISVNSDRAKKWLKEAIEDIG